MNIDEQYMAACFPEPVRLLGVTLRPFSLGHMLLLRWLDNAFVRGGVPGIEDLVTGIWVCSQSYAEAVAALRSGAIEIIERRRWRTRRRIVRLDDAFGRWQQIVGNIDLVPRCGEFTAYVRAGCIAPTVCTVGGAREPADDGEQCPEVQAVKVALMHDLHLTEADVMDRPWALCLWDLYTLRVQAGTLRFMDDGKIADAQALANQLKERIDRGEVKFSGA